MQEYKNSVWLTSNKSRKHFKPCFLMNKVERTEKKNTVLNKCCSEVQIMNAEIALLAKREANVAQWISVLDF